MYKHWLKPLLIAVFLVSTLLFGSCGVKGEYICVMNTDGSNITRLATEKEGVWHPTWSPDGTKIMFDSLRDGEKEIYVMDSNGSNQKRLTYNGYHGSNHSWSPDGTKIAFTFNTEGIGIYTMNADGSGQRRLTLDRYDSYDPEWSPDSSKIVFRSDTPEGSHCINTMNADGSNINKLPSNGLSFQPSFSPDGEKIVFVETNL